MKRLIERVRKALVKEKEAARRGFFDVLSASGVKYLPVRPLEGYGSLGGLTALGAAPVDTSWGGGARVRAAVARESLQAALRACGEDASRQARDRGGEALHLRGMNLSWSGNVVMVMAWGEVMKGEAGMVDDEDSSGGVPRGADVNERRALIAH